MYKKQLIVLTLLCMCNVLSMHAQAPHGINYQGAARNLNGQPLVNRQLGLKISVTDGSNGFALYTETTTVLSSPSGLFNTTIGKGTPVTGTFSGIDWSNGTDKWIRIEMDTAGGSNYILVGSQQLMSVPYALYAERAGISTAATTPSTYSMIAASSPSLNFWQSVSYCRNKTDGGFTDWRLPSLDEVVNYTTMNGIPASGFKSWTTTLANQSGVVYIIVDLTFPDNGNSSTNADHTPYFVQCVR